MPIADRHNDYAHALKKRFFDAGLRAEVDTSSERMQYKVRQAELYKVPYIVILGDKEIEGGALSFRSRKEPNQNGVGAGAFIAHLQKHAQARSLEIKPLEMLAASS